MYTYIKCTHTRMYVYHIIYCYKTVKLICLLSLFLYVLFYRGRPTAAPVGAKQEVEKERPLEAGGCTHASDQLVRNTTNYSC